MFGGQPMNSEAFSEWALTVKVHELAPNVFGMRDFEHLPDHKRVMNTIMSASPSNLLRQGLLEKTSANHYAITALGKAEFERRFGNTAVQSNETGSAMSVFKTLKPYLKSLGFNGYVNNTDFWADVTKWRSPRSS